ncbi:Endonuclease/exonuclease/phosphatase [Lasiosphaeria hispida]|uniref:Endonuclease/exonuclease/phosphatase n=1 Tax=Lasiosphaeria hispida TaxID=260671 RepID=A0AAJ0MEL3_9PEZI|nr:Endonuclease/exonuclease/phosphatase [Lasiosphaeria hispida]
MDRDISPPPPKRQKLQAAEDKKEIRQEGSFSSPRTAPDQGTVRLFTWNINGIAPFLPQPESSQKITSFFKPSTTPTSSKSRRSPTLLSDSCPQPPLQSFLSRHNYPEVLFLQELKISPSKITAISALVSALNTAPSSSSPLPSNRTYTFHPILPRDRHNARGFNGALYGVGTLLRTDFSQKHVACVRGVEWDLEGRVCIVEAKAGRNPTPPSHPPLALINIYAVNGTSAPYRSPETGLVTGARHDFKREFHTRLRDECLALERRGFGVVVAGDVNVARGVLDGWPRLRTAPREHCVNRADFNGKFFGRADNERARADVGEGGGKGGCLDAVDVFRAVHGRERRYTYFPRGREWGTSCDRVDMVFVSMGLWEAGRVLRTGILDTPEERGSSDHVPVWAELRFRHSNC